MDHSEIRDTQGYLPWDDIKATWSDTQIRHLISDQLADKPEGYEAEVVQLRNIVGL